MNRKDIEKYNAIQKKTFNTSDVIKDSFVSVLKELKTSDFVIVKNNRQQVDMVVQDIDTFVGIEKVNPQKFNGRVQTVEENKFLLRTYIRESIYYLMRFEDKNITFPEVNTILENSTYYKDKFIKQITHQLADGYKYIINLPNQIDVKQFIHLQGIIAKDQALEWGVLRSGAVSITGTSYIPPIVKQKDITQLINRVRLAKDKYEEIALLLSKVIKMQPFWDGNKRSSFLLANRLMIEYNLGLIAMDEKHLGKFNILLQNYYNNDSELETLSNFIQSKLMFNTIDKKLIR